MEAGFSGIQETSSKLSPGSVRSAEVLVDFSCRDEDGQADEEELLLLLQPDQLHDHPTVRVKVHHYEFPAAVVEGLDPALGTDVDGRADAPEGFLEDVQQGQTHDAAVLQKESVRAERPRPGPEPEPEQRQS